MLRVPDRDSDVRAHEIVLVGGEDVEDILIIIGMILILIFTGPILFIMIAVEIYRMRREDPDAPPPSKDEWRLM